MRETSKKTMASITLLMIALVFASIFLSFLTNQAEACNRRRRHPPLGKTLIKHFVYPDGSGIGSCLEVTLWNDEQLYTAHTDETGTITFAGIPDGTYTLSWSWQSVEMRESVELRCSQLVWEFTNELPYWTVIKTFYYNTEPPVPISHLKVTMNGYSGETDVTGTVVFSNVKAGSYTIEWIWGGETQTEGLEIDFATLTPVELTNYLPPKSWWRQNKLYLAEELG